MLLDYSIEMSLNFVDFIDMKIPVNHSQTE